MRMMKLAFMNFKSNFKNYLALVISLAFTILIFLNFQNVIYSDSFEVLGEKNKEYVDIAIQLISFVLVCFMFFFIWYATNVFLTKRKKEIGIYVFMGLSNQKIGRLYMIEVGMIGFSALVIGIFSGVVMGSLFQMVLLAISDIAAPINFRFGAQPIVITTGIYLVVYLIFVVKGYYNIVKSSVLDMVSATRQNEYVRQNSLLLFLKAVLGSSVLGAGFYLAVKEGGQEVLAYVTAAVMLVTAGVYLLFGGLIPLIFQGMAGNKNFLYHKQRCLWINSMIFRMKRNYRTYAMVCVLVLCSVTALATGFAMKERYDNMMQFERTYTFQILSEDDEIGKRVGEVIENHSDLAVHTEIPILQLESSLVKADENYGQYALIAYTNLKELAQQTGEVFKLPCPGDDEVVRVSHLYLLSLITRSDREVSICGKSYRQIEETNTSYLGYLQKQVSFYVVNDEEFERLLPYGQKLYCRNYRLKKSEEFAKVKELARDEVNNIRENMESYIGMVSIDPLNSDQEWIKVLYSLCIFMFMVFLLASGSIMFMKLYNDAFEEKERYLVMRKMGFDHRVLKKSVANELGNAYGIPFLVMSISSYFSVHALGNMMYTDLGAIHLASVLVVFIIFLFCYLLSVSVYWKNVGIGEGGV